VVPVTVNELREKNWDANLQKGMDYSRYRGSQTLYSDENKDHKVGWNMHRIPGAGSRYVRNNAVDRIEKRACLPRHALLLPQHIIVSKPVVSKISLTSSFILRMVNLSSSEIAFLMISSTRSPADKFVDIVKNYDSMNAYYISALFF